MQNFISVNLGAAFSEKPKCIQFWHFFKVEMRKIRSANVIPRPDASEWTMDIPFFTVV